MKNRKFIKYSILVLLPAALALGVISGSHFKEISEVNGYSGAELPTTIYLTDSTESQIRSYYSGLTSLSTTERKGNNLLKNLKNILSNGQKYYNYDSGDLVWKMYEITDRDWVKSPASSITYGSYDATNNKITNYVYGSNSNGKNNPYIHSYYMDYTQENVVRAWGNHNQDATGINREHLWAKAEGFEDGTGTEAGARGDPMHLVAANGYANNIHSNHFYGYVDTSKSYTDVKDKYSTLGHNLSGKSKTFPSSSVEVFEPQDSDKGDIARAIFYMAARYNNIAGKSASQETFNQNNPNLLLTDNLSNWQSSGYISSATTPGYMGLVSDLLEWNKLDPVDEYEIHRNNLLYRNFTNNRNPFIDFPEWADIIWGGGTSTANPSTDPINGEGTPTTKVVKSIEITTAPSKIVYTAGETFSSNGMVVTAHYSDNTSAAVTGYTVSHTGKLTCADKIITISFEGFNTTQRITVNPPSGGITYTWDLVTSTSDLTVDENYIIAAKDFNVAMSTVQNGNNRGEYAVTKLNGSLSYADPSSSSDPTVQVFTLKAGNKDNTYSFYTGAGYIYSASNSSNLLRTETKLSNNSSWIIAISSGKTTLTSQGSNTHNTLFYNVSNNLFSSYTSDITTQKDIVLYKKTAHASPVVHPTSVSLDKTNLTLTEGESETLNATVLPENVSDNSVTWESSNETVATVDEFGQVTALSSGTAIITAKAHDTEGNKTASCSLTVEEPIVLSSLSISGTYKTEYYVGDAFSTDGITVYAHYTQGQAEVNTVDVTSQCEFDGYDLETTGSQTVNVIFDSIFTTYSITVSEAPFEENTVNFIASQFGLDNSQSINEITIDNFVITFNSTASKYYDNGSAFRVYGGNSFTITGPKDIVSVRFVFADGEGSNALSTNVGTCDASTGAWSSEEGVSSLTYTVAGTSGHRRIQQIIVKYDPESSQIAVLSGIELGGTYKTSFFQSETFDYDGLVVTASYSDLSTSVVTPTSVSTPDFTTPGKKTITVSYTEGDVTKTATYNITVKTPTVCSKTYRKITSEDEFIEGVSYILGYEEDGVVKALSNSFVNSGQYASISLNVNDGIILEGFEDCAVYLTDINHISENSMNAKITDGNKWLKDGSDASIEASDSEKSAYDFTVKTVNGLFQISGLTRAISYKKSTDKIGFFSLINITTKDDCDYKNLNIYIETLSNCNNYVAISDPDDLRTGDKIILAAAKNNVYYSADKNASETSYIAAHEIQGSSLALTPDENTQIYEIVRTDNGICFYDPDSGYISSNSSKSNEIKYVPSTTPESTFTVQSLGTLGAFSAVAQGKYSRNCLKFNSSASPMRFNCYASDSNILIYKSSIQIETDEWSKDFLSKTGSCRITDWSDLANSYYRLSTEAKEELSNLLYADSLDTNMSWRAQAVARYDYILSDARYDVEAFINGRGESNYKYSIFEGIKSVETSTIIASIVGVLGVSAIGGYFFYKKRKEGRI